MTDTLFFVWTYSSAYCRKITFFIDDVCYSTSKHALTRWMRRVSPSWAVEGTRINAVAPGNTTTPMTQNMTPEQKEAALLIPIPTRVNMHLG